MAIAAHRGTVLRTKYHRLVRSRGRLKAIVALERTLITIIRTMLRIGTSSTRNVTPTATSRDPSRTRRRELAQLEILGLTVQILKNEAS